MNLFEVAHEIAERLTRIFLRDERGRRPVYGGRGDAPDGSALARLPPLLRVLPRRDNGAGIGASHQTGWTGLVATFIQLLGRLDGARLLEVGRKAAFERQLRLT